MKKHDVNWKRKGLDSPKKDRDKDQPVVQRKHKKLRQARDSDEEASD